MKDVQNNPENLQLFQTWLEEKLQKSFAIESPAIRMDSFPHPTIETAEGTLKATFALPPRADCRQMVEKLGNWLENAAINVVYDDASGHPCAITLSGWPSRLLKDIKSTDSDSLDNIVKQNLGAAS